MIPPEFRDCVPLIKLETKDGFIGMNEKLTEIGRLYYVDRGSRRIKEFIIDGNKFLIEIIDVWDECFSEKRFLPTELLDI